VEIEARKPIQGRRAQKSGPENRAALFDRQVGENFLAAV
jgi:hypothetical protein